MNVTLLFMSKSLQEHPRYYSAIQSVSGYLERAVPPECCERHKPDGDVGSGQDEHPFRVVHRVQVVRVEQRLQRLHHRGETEGEQENQGGEGTNHLENPSMQ